MVRVQQRGGKLTDSPNILERAILAVSPERALKRARARRGVLAYYEAAESSRFRKRPRESGSPDLDNQRGIELMRAQARHLERNYDLAVAVLDTLVNNIVGAGNRPEPQVKNVDGDLYHEVNEQILDLWDDWVKYPEVAGDLNYYQSNRLFARAWCRDGECFQQNIAGFVPGLEHNTRVPFSIEYIESDFLPVGFSDPRRRIVQSIQKNAWGRATQYWLYKAHPGDLYSVKPRLTFQPDKTIPADRVIHVKQQTRFRQTRGVSLFAAVLNRVDDIKDTEESERVAARCAAAMVGYRKKGSPDDWVENEFDTDDDSSTQANIEFEPGMILNLRPGEDIGTIQSNRPNNALIPFLQEQFRRFAGGTKTGYSTITRHYAGNYSAQRQELVEQHVNYGVLFDDLKTRKLVPDYENFMRAALMSKLVEIPPDVDMDTLLDVEIIRPAMPWVDPGKEASAYKTLLNLGVVSRSQIIRARGHRPEDVFRQIEHERRHHPLTTSKPGADHAKSQ